jgi:hypothetical protein
VGGGTSLIGGSVLVKYLLLRLSEQKKIKKFRIAIPVYIFKD